MVGQSKPAAFIGENARRHLRCIDGTNVLSLVMLGIAGGMALFLGIVGIYGVMSYSVSQRTREIGIRMALGAHHGKLKGQFVRQGVLLAGIGAVFGLAGAAALTRSMASLLFSVKPVDPMTYVIVAAD